MTVYGYARVSTDGQTLASQDAQLHAAGCAKVYGEKVSGTKTDRAELARLLKRLETGDVLMVTRLDRLARSTRDLLNILHTLGERRSPSAARERASRGRGHTLVRSDCSHGGTPTTWPPKGSQRYEGSTSLLLRHSINLE